MVSYDAKPIVHSTIQVLTADSIPEEDNSFSLLDTGSRTA